MEGLGLNHSNRSESVEWATQKLERMLGDPPLEKYPSQRSPVKIFCGRACTRPALSISDRHY